MTEAATNDPVLLFDESALDIEGERVVVREYRYSQGLRAAVIARPLLAGLRELIQDLDAPEDLSPEAIDTLVGEHHEVWLELIALCVGKPVEWVAGLPDSVGQRLSLEFWGGNAGFFTRRLIVSSAVSQGLASRSRSRSSSPSSSAPDTDETTTSSPSDTAGDRSDATTR